MLKRTEDFLRQTDDFYCKREKDFREIYSQALMEVYNTIDVYIKDPVAIDSPIVSQQLEKLKTNRDNLHTYLVKLELCDIPVKEHK